MAYPTGTGCPRGYAVRVPKAYPMYDAEYADRVDVIRGWLESVENLRTNPDLMRSMGEFLVRHTGNDMNFMATRVSYEIKE